MNWLLSKLRESYLSRKEYKMRDVIQRMKFHICLVAILSLLVTALAVSPVFADDEEIDDSIKGIFEQYENS